ncbi:hypothetical protein O1611_g534 [Lasiodiplodia mahajangana]|uniref:Uncharacterized protein n=1 Tax=Lasiodiplodia mahajangana TaxID=1108764 RepID=A0ACC2K0L7_9PEZI|nr:hypothetical protein O1611_g534 [Lasiodiplodia mahajangana]
MNHGYSLQLRHRVPTDVLWWDSTSSVGEEVRGPRFDERLNLFRRSQEGKTSRSPFSIDIVILIEEPAPPSARGAKEVGLSITRAHYNDLITTFHLSPSFARRKRLNTGYHYYIKDNPSVHDESPLIFAAQSPRLRNEDIFLTMRVCPLTNSTMCIITVPTEGDREWLRTKISDHHHEIMIFPAYLFNILCERLDYRNEIITSEVLSVFEEQENEMERFCGEARAFNSVKRGGRHPNENKIYEEHGKAIVKLNDVNNKLMTLGCTTDFELSALGFAQSIMDRYIKLCAASNPSNHLPRISDEQRQVFDNEIEALQTATRLRQTMRTSVQQRAEHMVSLLRASNSQRDAVYHLEISENSRKTSSQARNLTLLGSLFIPPTFVATVFGANVFPVDPETKSLEVSNEWWILVASTVGLTMLVFLVVLVCIRSKKTPESLKSRCPLSGSGRDATTPAYIPLKHLAIERQI